MKQKTLREDAHPREAEATARDARMCQGTFFIAAAKHMFGFEYFVKLMVML